MQLCALILIASHKIRSLYNNKKKQYFAGRVPHNFNNVVQHWRERTIFSGQCCSDIVQNDKHRAQKNIVLTSKYQHIVTCTLRLGICNVNLGKSRRNFCNVTRDGNRKSILLYYNFQIW